MTVETRPSRIGLVADGHNPYHSFMAEEGVTMKPNSGRYTIPIALIAATLSTAVFSQAQKPTNSKTAMSAITVVDAGGRTVGRLDSNRVFALAGTVPLWLELDQAPGADPTKLAWANALPRKNSSALNSGFSDLVELRLLTRSAVLLHLILVEF